MLGAEFKVTPDLTFNVDAFHSKLDAAYVQNRFIVRPGNSVAGGVIPSNVTMNGNVLASGRFNNTGSAMGTQLETYVNPKAQSKTEYLNGDVKYRLTENLKVTGQVGKTKAEGEACEYGNTIFLPNVASAYTYEGAGSPSKVSLPNGVSGSNFSGWPGNSGADNNYSLQHSLDKETYGNADAEYRFDDSIWHSVKFGVRGADHERYGTRPMKAGVPSTPLIMADPVVEWSNANLSADRAFNLPVSGVFAVKEKVASLYGMARMAGERWRADFGVRYVRTKVSVTTNTGVPCGVPSATNGITYGSPAQATACASFVPAGAVLTTGSRFGNCDTRTTDSDYKEILPSANFTLDASSRCRQVARKSCHIRTAAKRATACSACRKTIRPQPVRWRHRSITNSANS